MLITDAGAADNYGARIDPCVLITAFTVEGLYIPLKSRVLRHWCGRLARNVYVYTLIRVLSSGIRRFSDDIKEMLGFPVGSWWKFCWAVVAPFFILGKSVLAFQRSTLPRFSLSIYEWRRVVQVIIASGLVNYERLSYNEYKYPWSADAVGICVAASSVLCIPAFAIWNLIRTPGTLAQRLRRLTTPWRDQECDFKKDAGALTSSPPPVSV
ncbi:hypothetical protein HPB51_009253 [Rhipicephalus microplus]|uniref:Uncharacterized protein n=1 Tax=Rhipicephalus microplus TaxID=6941 RepID=A0A9J6F0N2_RHIMP|nr:hypothetical protein HPB51_009253 [Rhipicephalus microplus]